MFWHRVSDTPCQFGAPFGRLAAIDAKPPFSHHSKRSGGYSCYPLGGIGHHSALFDETLRRLWQDPPPYMAKLSALLDKTLRRTCIKVRRRVAWSTAESRLKYGGALELSGRRVVQRWSGGLSDLMRRPPTPPPPLSISVDRPRHFG